MIKKELATFEASVIPQDKVHPSFRPGDTIRVHYKVEEGSAKGKYRIQQYEGVCTCFKKGTMNATFTVRKISANNVGVERIFPLVSPFVDRIDLISRGKVRRARLYYLRERAGKAARIVTKRFKANEILTTVSKSGETLPSSEG